jgi:hypothetical protein
MIILVSEVVNDTCPDMVTFFFLFWKLDVAINLWAIFCEEGINAHGQ